MDWQIYQPKTNQEPLDCDHSVGYCTYQKGRL